MFSTDSKFASTAATLVGTILFSAACVGAAVGPATATGHRSPVAQSAPAIAANQTTVQLNG
ncbi:MAG: hypothetical protein H0X36_12850 [Sphingomonadaceae bacterium]|nr:hypothetical protein [Sphingomonadaceae bacterium]